MLRIALNLDLGILACVIVGLGLCVAAFVRSVFR